jgi:ATP-dependent exoDNAse (exonuclease V) beta subunit
VPYSPSVAFHDADPEGEPCLETFAERDGEARRVVDLVKAAKGKTAILVRNRNHLDTIVPAFKDAGIRFRAVEIEQLGEKQVVQDLYALTRALTHLADRVAWLAILRAPWCGLALDELSELFEGKDKQTVWELMQEAPRLARMREVLAPALADRLRGTLRDRVEGVWLALGGPACVEDATDLEDAEIFLDELERLEEAGELTDFSALASSLEDLYALPDVDAGVDAVEIMTIHKAKGLEFDTVIVPGLDRPPRSGRKPLFAWRSLPGVRLLLAPIDETGGDKEPLYQYVRDLDKEAEDIEAGRLLYVAATRAESRLHLLACLKLDEDGVVKMPSKRSLLGLSWPAMSSSISLPSPAPAGQANTWGGAEGPGERERASLPTGELRRLPADFEMPKAPRATEWKSPEEGREEEQIEFSWVGETARHMGTVVHAWLHRIADDELKGWDTARVARARAAIRGQLSARGVSGAELEAATERVLEALRNSIADQKGRWVLGAHPEASSEYRIRTRDRSYVIDRVIRDASGIRWVVDFKTSRHEGADIEGFLDREQKRYAAQLDAYSAALGGASRGLYFPLHTGWRTWKSSGEGEI